MGGQRVCEQGHLGRSQDFGSCSLWTGSLSRCDRGRRLQVHHCSGPFHRPLSGQQTRQGALCQGHVHYALPADEKAVKTAEWIAEKWAPFNESLDKFLAANGGNGFLVGDSWSSADLLFFTYLGAVQVAAGGAEKVPLSDHQKKFMGAIAGVKGIDAFLKDAKKNPTVEGFVPTF